MASDWRKTWQNAKKVADANGVNLSKVCKDTKFGPLLDTAFKACEACEKDKGNDFEATAKLRAALKKAAVRAREAGGVYMVSLRALQKTDASTALKDAAQTLCTAAMNIVQAVKVEASDNGVNV